MCILENIGPGVALVWPIQIYPLRITHYWKYKRFNCVQCLTRNPHLPLPAILIPARFFRAFGAQPERNSSPTIRAQPHFRTPLAERKRMNASILMGVRPQLRRRGFKWQNISRGQGRSFRPIQTRLNHAQALRCRFARNSEINPISRPMKSSRRLVSNHR